MNNTREWQERVMNQIGGIEELRKHLDNAGIYEIKENKLVLVYTEYNNPYITPHKITINKISGETTSYAFNIVITKNEDEIVSEREYIEPYLIREYFREELDIEL